jgi:hypothetical protein
MNLDIALDRPKEVARTTRKPLLPTQDIRDWMTPNETFHPGPERFGTLPKSCEGAARAALDWRAGRSLTDADWAVAKDRLLEFFTILRGWDRRARTVSRDLVMFEVPCLREL